VRPVNDRDIRLPTDGYNVPGAAEQFLLGRETAGETGGTRPMPRAAEPSPTGPDLSLIDQDPAALADGRAPAGTAPQTAIAAVPGFSINDGE
jgi:pilus assembly protein CpaC